MPALFTALAVPITAKTTETQEYFSMESPKIVQSVTYDVTAHVITLTSINEKAGVTTASMMLATLLQHNNQQNNRVAVLDLNTFNPDLYYYTDNEVCEFLSLSDESTYHYDDILLSAQNTYNKFDCFTIFGDQHPGQKESNNLKQLIHQLSAMYNIIIIDTANYTTDNLYTLLALQNAHTALCVSLSDEKNLVESERKIKEFTDSTLEGGLDLRGRTGMLLNQTTTDLLTLHRKTNQLRNHTNIVGSFPKVTLPAKQQETMEHLLDDPHLIESGSLVLKHIFNDRI